MSNPTYEPEVTALLCIDFYNDFLSEGGKLWPMVKDIAEEVKLLDNLRAIVAGARETGIQVFHVPHHRMTPESYKGWKHVPPYLQQAADKQIFAKGTWGAPSTTISRSSRAMSFAPNTGVRVASPTLILISSSSGTARRRLSALDC
jgi:hypothetical protein